MTDFPALNEEEFRSTDADQLDPRLSDEPIKILMLYGSLRDFSYSRFMTLEAERILTRLGAETVVFDLAVMQVNGGSQSFNTVNQLRILGRWMRLVTIPNQSSVPKAWDEFDGKGRMKPSPFYNRMVDVMEELVKFTHLTRNNRDHLLDRYSERIETTEALSKRVNKPKD